MTRAAYHAEQLRSFQEALLPRACRSCGHAELASAFRPAEGHVGGDFHDAIPLGGRDAYVIGDVTGHGPSAAMVMAVLFGAFRQSVLTREWPCAVLNDTHQLLSGLGQRSGGPRLFSATAFLALLDEGGRLTWANAGHHSPVVLRANGSAEPLEGGEAPLGFLPPSGCVSTSVQLSPGDRLLLYTDGVFAESRVLGPEPWRHLLPLEGESSHDHVDRLVSSGAADDRTAVVVTYRGH